MPDPANEVVFERAAEILDISQDELEQLLDTGVLRGYRRGDDIVFRRDDLASFITSSSAAEAALRQAKRPASAGRRRGAMSDLKKAAMGKEGVGEGMFSLKQYAKDQGVIDEGPRTSPPSAPSPVAGMPSGQEPLSGPSPLAGISPQPEPQPQVVQPQVVEPPAIDDAQRLVAENEGLKERLQAAEEVLNDLQRRCEEMSQVHSQNQTLTNQMTMLQTALVEQEGKVAAYEDMDSDGSDGLGWRAPDADDKLIALKREAAEMRGEMAALKRRTDEAEKDVQRHKAERDDLDAKLRAARSSGGGDTGRVVELEKELGTLNADMEDLTAERDMLAIEAEVAKELRGEIERASELEDKLNTQREVIEAAQERLEQLELERDELEERVRDLGEKASLAESGEAKAGELSERLQAVEEELKAEREKATQLEARTTALRAERDTVAEEMEGRDDEIARLRVEAQKTKAASEEVERLKSEVEKAKSKAETAEFEMHKAHAQMSLKDQLIEQYKVEERDQSGLESENVRFREKLAEAEGKAKQAQARMTAIRAERDQLTAEYAKREGAVDELRSQAERASALLGENRALKHDLEAARVRAAELESAVEMSKSERDGLTSELKAATSKADDLERRLVSQERDLGSAREKVEAAPADDRLRRELNALRSDIASQMKELGQVRAQGEAATRRRSRSAQEIAKKSRRSPSGRRAPRPAPPGAPGKKPDSLGRFAIGEEIRRSRTGMLYRSSLPHSDKPVDVLTLPPEVARDRLFLDRFWREIRIVSELDHKNLVGVIDVGETGGVHYVAYEHVEGESMDALLRREEKLAPERALGIMREVAAGLVAASKKGIVHGDLKPGNVVLTSDGGVKVLGLGLARGTDEDASELNQRGRIELYAAPEQLLGEGRDVRSDVYSAGAVFYKILTGKAPLEAGSLSEARGLVELGELPRPEELTELSPGLRGVLAKTLTVKPDGRYDSAVNLAAALKMVKP